MSVRIGSWAGFWGDSRGAAKQLVLGTELDYLVGDHLAEITMALLARFRMKDPTLGYVPDVVKGLAPLMGELSARGVKVITNAGGLNPAGCAAALRDAAAEAGVSLKVAWVEGDDVLPRLPGLREAGAVDMFTGEALPEHALTMNAYLGARPIATALDMGADIVVTGRCADSALVLGPLMHEFGWSDDDFDLLSAGSLIGHVVECGTQCTGGLFTDWWTVPGWENMGYPVAECEADGTAVIGKPDGTGGLVTPPTVGEQILYEIGDPGAYILPDVVCDWRSVQLEQVGSERVRVSGAKGSAPTGSYKATTTALDGFRMLATMAFNGLDAAGRARRAGEAMLARTERLAGEKGLAPFSQTSVEVSGGGDAEGRPGAITDGREAVVKIGARHADQAALAILSTEMIPFGLIAQGLTGVASGRPKPQPVIRLFHVLVDKASVPVTVTLGDETRAVEVAPGNAEVPGTEPLAEPAAVASGGGETVTVPLRAIAYARSGDKGNDANVGVMARRPEFVSVIHEQVTAARVAEVFGAWLEGDVRRWELPGLGAINILMRDVLGGRGGTSSLRLDPQGKSYGAILLALPVTVPAAWEREGLLGG
ncbi:MAG: DUF1446 domain-containing protein [Solirubrobacteraceae bacterium]|nr:DUF1446 domain-containing protein [Solirubrobacteraceae bacterium]